MREAYFGIQVDPDGVTHHVAVVSLHSPSQYQVLTFAIHGSRETEFVVRRSPDRQHSAAIDPWFGYGLAERLTRSGVPAKVVRLASSSLVGAADDRAVALALHLANQVHGSG
ncbi:hypothetical protein [Streptomyces sp. ISL-94]|uniref:hypothetical protein n=1 Tax=Streptomyces sp. ISL-94 TaxID=2819190 RepID=UPI001BE7DC88|nr:hypothetical protein [Streptomyces sp. ISL-94]MBT2477637.1 hypothetical protein [Streptomyces sp. ISL-94]